MMVVEFTYLPSLAEVPREGELAAHSILELDLGLLVISCIIIAGE